jgi:hypothetical protein
MLTSTIPSTSGERTASVEENNHGTRIVFTEEGLDMLFDIITPLNFRLSDGELDRDIPINPQVNRTKIKIRDTMLIFDIDDVNVSFNSEDQLIGFDITFLDHFFHAKWYLSAIDSIDFSLFQGDIWLIIPPEDIEMEIWVEPTITGNFISYSVKFFRTNLNARAFQVDLDGFRWIPRAIVDWLTQMILDNQIEDIINFIAEEINITIILNYQAILRMITLRSRAIH